MAPNTHDAEKPATMTVWCTCSNYASSSVCYAPSNPQGSLSCQHCVIMAKPIIQQL